MVTVNIFIGEDSWGQGRTGDHKKLFGKSIWKWNICKEYFKRDICKNICNKCKYLKIFELSWGWGSCLGLETSWRLSCHPSCYHQSEREKTHTHTHSNEHKHKHMLPPIWERKHIRTHTHTIKHKKTQKHATTNQRERKHIRTHTHTQKNKNTNTCYHQSEKEETHKQTHTQQTNTNTNTCHNQSERYAYTNKQTPHAHAHTQMTNKWRVHNVWIWKFWYGVFISACYKWQHIFARTRNEQKMFITKTFHTQAFTAKARTSLNTIWYCKADL